MPKILFMPGQQWVEVEGDTKILAAARKYKIDIRFGCAACRCGTCGVAVKQELGQLNAIKPPEMALLSQMGLSTSGDIRLACQARILEGEITVDLDFQFQYDPDDLNDS